MKVRSVRGLLMMLFLIGTLFLAACGGQEAPPAAEEEPAVEEEMTADEAVDEAEQAVDEAEQAADEALDEAAAAVDQAEDALDEAAAAVEQADDTASDAADEAAAAVDQADDAVEDAVDEAATAVEAAEEEAEETVDEAATAVEAAEEEAEETVDEAATTVAEATDGIVAEPVTIEEDVRQAFGGGPVGGAFQTFANGMALIMQDDYAYLDIAAEGTGGSGANLRGVNADDFQYGLVYAGDAYLGLNGLLPEDPAIYDNLKPLSALYGGVAHLVVSEASGIESVEDLPGKRVALGNAGSGAALAAERYFTTLELIDEMQVEFLGYSQAAQAMADGQLDGFWVLAAFPNSAVIEASTFTDVRLIDLYNPGVEAGFFDEYPFYTERALLGGQYNGVDEDVPSFQDTAMLVSNADVADDLVYNALVAIYSDAGLEAMREAHPAAAEMSRESGVAGIPVPLHPGAARYWETVGTDVPDEIQP